MTGPLTPSSRTSLIIDCPVCYRTIWANSTCHHGRIPPPDDEKPAPVNAGPVPELAKKEPKRGRRD